MKTFEERYTAWIDGELEGSARTAFEQELVRRAAVGEAEADKAHAAQLRALLQDHLKAPVLTNPDFFNHQLRQRIDAECVAAPRGRDAARSVSSPVFAWGFARLIGLGALSLFAAAALYYGMMPPHTDSPTASDNAVAQTAPDHGGSVAGNPAPTPVPQPADVGNPGPPGGIEFAQRSATPAPIDFSPDIKTFVPDQPANPTTITPLHYNQSNVNVLWLNGLEYLPSVSDAQVSPVTPTASSGSATP